MMNTLLNWVNAVEIVVFVAIVWAAVANWGLGGLLLVPVLFFVFGGVNIFVAGAIASHIERHQSDDP